MRLSASTLALLAAPALALAGPPGESATPGAGLEPAAASTAAGAGPPAPAPAVGAPPAAAAPPVVAPAVAPTPALLEKLGKGDRLFSSGDHRNALFAYQDAVYLQPAYAPARVKLGRTYLQLRYPAQAVAQAEAALADDPECAEAKALLEEASAAASRPVAPEAASAPGGPRVFKLLPPAESAPAGAAGGDGPAPASPAGTPAAPGASPGPPTAR